MNELRTLFRHRQLIAALTARDLKARYRGSLLGYFWSLANPLLLLAVYTLVFTKFFPQHQSATQPFPLFLFSGILPWTFFAAATLEGTSSISANAGLIKKVMFPAEALPLVVVLSHLVHFALAIPILLLAILAFAAVGQSHISATILLVPVLMFVQTIFVAGIALIVSSASVLFRDLRDIITNLMQLGFFVTPIIYLIDNVQSRPLRALLRMNPMTPFVVSYQDVLFFGRLPNLSDTILMLAYAAASLTAGFFVFDRLRDTLAEAI
ncbi:MAG: lipopolysaccharide transport system permease protein [Acidobacteriota bacterium]|jgi:ABC-type polysaccharide/polyol phosphate export permease|nr:lipopolysaccharide transport system permease protein [Acidobacteriota bacterium]